MSDDLSKRLRGETGRYFAREAADRIDALTAERDEAQARAVAMHRRAQATEGALTKANEMLALASDNGGKSSRNTVRYYRKWREAEAENAALRARLETPGEEALDRIVAIFRTRHERLCGGRDPQGTTSFDGIVADALTALRADLAEARAALTKIAAPGYGLQGIQEDYGHDTNAYNYHAGKYFTDQYFGLQKIARAALAPKEPPHAAVPPPELSLVERLSLREGDVQNLSPETLNRQLSGPIARPKYEDPADDH